MEVLPIALRPYIELGMSSMFEDVALPSKLKAYVLRMLFDPALFWEPQMTEMAK